MNQHLLESIEGGMDQDANEQQFFRLRGYRKKTGSYTSVTRRVGSRADRRWGVGGSDLQAHVFYGERLFDIIKDDLPKFVDAPESFGFSGKLHEDGPQTRPPCPVVRSRAVCKGQRGKGRGGGGEKLMLDRARRRWQRCCCYQ